MPTYEINLENFSGPISKLLSLIEEKKYEVTSVNLAKVTGDFLDYMNSLEKAEPRLLADFVAVAARLILIKSRELIPDLELTPEEEEGIHDLEDRLKIYKQFKDASSAIIALYERHLSLFSRPEKKMKRSTEPIFFPPPSLTPDILLANLRKSINVIEEIEKRYEKYEALNFEEYVSNLWNRVSGRIAKFSEVTGGKKKEEIIILFLAILHLLRENKITVEQEGQFSDILIKSPGE